MDRLLSKLWNYVASSPSLTMQVRLFRLISLLSGVLCLGVVLPTNLLQNLPMVINVLLLVFSGFSLFCYRESLRGRDHSVAFVLSILGLMSPAWFYNGGSHGSVTYYYFSTVLIPMVLWRGRTRWIMTAAVLVNLVALLMLEYRFPQLTTAFANPRDRLIDLTTGIVTSGFLLAVITWVILASYDWEKQRISQFSKELTVSEKNYREVVENAKSIILRMSAQGEIRFFNKFAEETFGYRREDVIGQHVVGTIIPAVSSQGTDMSEFVNRVLQNPQAYAKAENENICRSGKRLRVAWTNQPVHDEQGQFVELLCVGIDITERAELLEKLQLTQATMDAAAEPIVWLKPDGRIIYANNAAGQVLGLTPMEPPGLALQDVLDQFTTAEWSKRWAELTRAGAINFEATLRGPGNSIRPVELSLTHMDIRGNEYATVFLHDMTERRQAEEKRRQQEQQMLQLQKLESLGILAGGIAHDFNNLLTAIMGNISLAKMTLPAAAEELPLLDEAEKASFQAKDLTAQLLTFSRGGKPVKRAVALNTIARECASFALRGGSAKCTVNLPSDLWPVEADAAQLAQVFNNLLINAQQAMPNGGEIRLQAQNEMLTAPNEGLVAAGPYVKITIEDQGGGIAPEILPRIFDPYFTTKRSGSGLGLAVVHSILKNHQGAIKVDSQPGQGATFTLWLPANRDMNTTPTTANTPSSQPAAQKKSRVLIMDDESMVRILLTKMLNRLGCEVEAAAEGAAAVEIYRNAFATGKRFDLVIMDLTIPGGMGGTEAIQHLRKIDPAVKAIVSSGYSSSPVMADYQEHGFVGVVMKPFTADQLSKALTPFLKS